MLKRTSIILVAAALLGAAACESGSESAQPSSSSTNWLMCEEDADCSELDPAICSSEGYCVDEKGVPIEPDASSQGSAGGNGTGAAGSGQTEPDAGVSGGGSTTEPDAGAGTSGGGSASTAGGSAGQPSAGASGGDPSQGGAEPTGSGGVSQAGAASGAGGETAGAGGAPSSQPSCSATGDPCCDPFPNDGANYCDNGLECFLNYCIDVSDLNGDCTDGACPDGLTPVTYFGIAGPSGPEFCSCSIPCADEPTLCPSGSTCATIADGPGTVCVQDESGGQCTAEGDTGCSGLVASPTPCCDGLVCCEGVPYPQDGECNTDCPLMSDLNLKTDIEPVDSSEILQSLASMPISTWRYRSEPDVQHLGPMAQDFRQTFGLGDSDKVIAPVDAIGVALASIQALNQRVEALAEENHMLKQRLEELSSPGDSGGQCVMPPAGR